MSGCVMGCSISRQKRSDYAAGVARVQRTITLAMVATHRTLRRLHDDAVCWPRMSLSSFCVYCFLPTLSDR